MTKERGRTECGVRDFPNHCNDRTDEVLSHVATATDMPDRPARHRVRKRDEKTPLYVCGKHHVDGGKRVEIHT